jgi:predicted nucleic acid-binding protein
VITDTQILSYYFKGAMALPNEQIHISSITAAEFLLVQSKTHNKANYYPILPVWLNHRGAPSGADSQGTSIRSMFDSRRHAALGKRRTDQLILDFGPSIPTYVEFGGIAITQLINNHHDQLYLASISHLDKLTQKKLIARFRFLLELGVSCVAVTPPIATVGLNLLAQFMDRYQPKDNKRNTVNDVLVLATAIKNETHLLTNDNLLTRFAAEVMTALAFAEGEYLRVDFSFPEVADRRKPLESMGFVNRGWQVLERRTRGR